MNKKNQDEMLIELLRSDRVGEPDEAIENRLMYSFLLKNNKMRIRQNSFSNLFGWIFSFEGMGIKTGLISFLLFLSILNNQFSFEPTKIGGGDSYSKQSIFITDTAHFIQPLDSLCEDSLN